MVIADDQALVRAGFRVILRDAGIPVVLAHETGLATPGRTQGNGPLAQFG